MALPAEFTAFVREFDANIDDLHSLLSSIPDQSTEQSQRELLKRATRCRDECANAMTGIAPKVRHYGYAQRTKCQAKLRECEDKLDGVARTIGNVELNVRSKKYQQQQHARSELLNGASHGRPVERIADQRDRLLNRGSLISEGDESLANTESMIATSIDMGADTHTALVQQREQFEHQREALTGMQAQLLGSNQTMRRIGCRIVTNRIVGIVAIIALMVANALVIYFKYFR